jgi:hypothetical protein
MSEKCLLCHLKMSVLQGKVAIQPFSLNGNLYLLSFGLPIALVMNSKSL